MNIYTDRVELCCSVQMQIDSPQQLQRNLQAFIRMINNLILILEPTYKNKLV